MKRFVGFHGHQRGWTLVELAVALTISALLVVLLFSFLPLGNRILDAEKQQQELAMAEQALLGYARTHGRLPAADGDGNGNGTADDGHDGPWLPVKNLGLPSRMRIHYQVQPSLVAVTNNQFAPLLPETAATSPINALDLCMQLLLNQRGGISLAGMSTPVAYYLGHSGVAGHAAIEASAQWNPAAQKIPGDGSTGTLAVVAAGPGELASRLDCTSHLARTQGSTQTAYAAYNAWRMTTFNVKFRKFNIDIAKAAENQARVARDLAIYALAEGITNEAIAITLLASGWPPNGLTIGAGIKQLVKSAIAIEKAIKALKEAQQAYGEAVKETQAMSTAHNQVQKYQGKVRLLYDNARSNAIKLDNAGLNQ